MHEKNEPLFTYLFIYAHFGNLILELNMVPGVPLEPYMSQGDQGVAETPIVSKGLMQVPLTDGHFLTTSASTGMYGREPNKDLSLTTKI